jgi:hypothetical protein
LSRATAATTATQAAPPETTANVALVNAATKPDSIAPS